MSRLPLRWVSRLVVIGLLGCAQPLPAADAPSAESQAAGKKVLGEWYAAVAAAKSYAAQVDGKVAIKQEGKVVQGDESRYRFAFERPQKFALTVLKGEGGVIVINDGKQFYEYAAQLMKYHVKAKPPATVGESAESPLVQMANFGQGIGPFSHALSAATAEDFLKNYEQASLTGVEDKNGAKVQRVRVVDGGMPIDLLFSADSRQLLSVMPDIKAGAIQTGQNVPPGIEIEMVVEFTQASYDAAPSAEAFAFVAPQGAEQVDDLFEQPPHPLLGKQAPAFETTALDGKPVKLADLAGKVVVLDFWATWCGPCVKALPTISAVAAKYKDKGVVFYAVNQQEEPSIIKVFLADQKLTVPVALDLEGKLGESFGVTGIPQTVIIDKNGKMQVIHVGAGDDIGEQLTKELDAVLAGEELADKKTKKKQAE